MSDQQQQQQSEVSQPTAMVQVQDGTMMELWPREGTRYMTSLGNDPAGIDLRVSAMGAVANRLKHYVGRVIAVRDWFIHKVQRIDTVTGEVSEGPRLVMVLTDGSLVVTSSQSVISTMGHLLSLTGFQRFDPPREFAVSEIPTANARTYLVITPVVHPSKPKK